MTFERTVLSVIAGVALTAVVLWALLSMAWASDNLFRLAKIGLGIGRAVIGPAVIWLLVLPLRKLRR